MTLDEMQTVTASQVAKVLCVCEESARGIMLKLPHMVIHQGKREAVRITMRTLERFVNGEIEERENARTTHRQGRVTVQKRKPQLPDDDKYEYYYKEGQYIPYRRLKKAPSVGADGAKGK